MNDIPALASNEIEPDRIGARRQLVARSSLRFAFRELCSLPSETMNPHQEEVDQVIAAYGTDARLGLTAGEARSRLDKYGKNELTAEKPPPGWRKFLAQFQDVLV